jgi:preprotein translocase subunit SecF
VSWSEALRTFRGYRVPRFRIIEHKKWWFLLSGSVIVASILGLVVRGINPSIDFSGGTQITYTNVKGVSPSAVQSLLAEAPYDRPDAEVQIVGGNQISIRTSALTDLTADQRAQLIDALARQAGVPASDVSVKVVGPTWGRQITRQAVIGLIVVLIAITLYITFRFEWKMAVGAQVAMIHDVLVTAGVYALTGRQVSPATVIAILTILGFSLYDTVVIYDKIKENTESPVLLAKDTYSGVVNTSVNQVFMRSVNTSLVVVLPILSLLLFGGATLKDFAFAMMIGVLTGAYSSIFVASPILALLKEREPRYVQLRARLEAKPAVERRLQVVRERVSPSAAVAEGSKATAAVGAAAASRTTARGGGGSRTRPKGKNRKRSSGKKRKR